MKTKMFYTVYIGDQPCTGPDLKNSLLRSDQNLVFGFKFGLGHIM